ncbi:unnamed protein product [Darwinula stevensoni]|uniref:RUN domain-containing protein n=1 Tax=Darwinula stevensoni TaxID=69355 RepID=A0A7R8X2W0_9CRUS|nr:unnamed protein product [Darwinula stevensoni]CAG0881666.1 unnamed protein product [Darwinula stevensoni]
MTLADDAASQSPGAKGRTLSEIPKVFARKAQGRQRGTPIRRRKLRKQSKRLWRAQYASVMNPGWIDVPVDAKGGYCPVSLSLRFGFHLNSDASPCESALTLLWCASACCISIPFLYLYLFRLRPIVLDMVFRRQSERESSVAAVRGMKVEDSLASDGDGELLWCSDYSQYQMGGGMGVGGSPATGGGLSLSTSGVTYEDWDAKLALIDFSRDDLTQFLQDNASQMSRVKDSAGEMMSSMSSSILQEWRRTGKTQDLTLDSTGGEISDGSLFSPMREGAFSVDSLDCSTMSGRDLTVTCQANKDHYTLAFDDLPLQSRGQSRQEEKREERTAMTQSVGGRLFTTWCRLKDDKSFSLPDLEKKKLYDVVLGKRVSTSLLRAWTSARISESTFDTAKDDPGTLDTVSSGILMQDSSPQLTCTSIQTSISGGKKTVYVYFPSYALPNLDFIKNPDADVYLVGRGLPKSKEEEILPRRKKHLSVDDLEVLKKRDLSKIKDWKSLQVLLPSDVKEILGCCDEEDEKSSSPRFTPEIKFRKTRPRSCDAAVLQKTPEEADRVDPGGRPKGILRKTPSGCEDDSRRSSFICRSHRESFVLDSRLKLAGESMCVDDVTDRKGDRVEHTPRPKILDLRQKATEMMGVTETLERRFHSEGNILEGSEDDASQQSCDCGCHRRRKSVSFANMNHSITCKECRLPRVASTGFSLPNTPMRNEWSFCMVHSPTSTPAGIRHLQDLVRNMRKAVESFTCCEWQELNSLHNWVLEELSPTLYAILSDGLFPKINTLFGPVQNSVWRVVETTSQAGLCTKALQDLVLHLNTDEHLVEGPLKFNAFICGLLNIGSLTSWLSYLRTRESAIHKHYAPCSFLYLSNGPARSLYDQILGAAKVLDAHPFQLDLLHESRLLHQRLQMMGEELKRHLSLEKLAVTPEHEKVGKTLRKSHSHDALEERDRGGEEGNGAIDRGSFSRLRRKWELWSGNKNNNAGALPNKSKIPRPVSARISRDRERIPESPSPMDISSCSSSVSGGSAPRLSRPASVASPSGSAIPILNPQNQFHSQLNGNMNQRSGTQRGLVSRDAVEIPSPLGQGQ